MMACTLPSAGHALGLGDIHVDSALNEPLSAEIDIVGATPEDLIGLIATVANRETFAHFNAERPSFLNSATFKVTTDAKGRPVLAIRSSESFSEPLIDLVVDLRWRNGQLIRQYSLLLDPAGFPAAPQAAAALPVPPTQAALPQTVITAAVSPASSPADPSETPTGSVPAAAVDGAVASSRSAQVSTRTMTQLKVGARATLRGVAWRVGARSKNDLNQMMIAIFRANPSAFDGNINRLRLGAMLRIPSAEEAAAIPYSEANRETRAQMKTWLASVKRPGSNPVSTVAETAPQPASQTTPGAAAADTAPSNTASASTASASTAPANAAPADTTKPAPVNTAAQLAASAPLASAPVAGAYSVSPPGSVAATSGQATATAPAATSGDAAGEKAALTTQLLSLEGNLQQLQAQLEEQHNKLLTLQAQQRYAEQHTKAVAAAAVVQKSDRGPLTAALAGMAVLAAACVALLMRLRRRANASSLPSIDKVPTLAQLEAETAAQAQKPKVTFRVPEAPRIEVQEFHEVPSDARAAAREEPIESALELSITDTSGINAAKLREELAAAKLREEIAAAWALPAAETYKREDIDHDSTLAQDIAKSLDDTVKLQQAHEGGDTIEEANSYIETIVGAAGDTGNYAAATALMPAPHTEPDPIHIDPENLDFNLMDLDGPDAHVRMEGTTQEHVVVKDRRTNLVDVLKQAIEREPHRRDLRIKLLETYYAEAATNRQGFLDAVQRLAQERGQMDEAEWQKIEQMGRKLGADSPELSSPQDPNLADCA
jgi:FimV-like protein